MPETLIESAKRYCNSLTRYRRLETREVRIGDVPLGGNNPIRVQSMTISDTMDTQATVEESIRMIEAGCEYVRITAPSRKEAENLKNIKAELRKRGYTTPLIADIHFTPNAAEIAARIVEKVRVNPGNYADKKKFEFQEYSDESYQSELQRIYDRFSPLVKICKEYGAAMRIGTNHGSLSDRIMSRYGDTPEGMVASALEFVDVCEDHGFDQIVISMKASNPVVMVAAYRLLAHEMLKRGRLYPLHLGVTEAGEGEDGRIKSAAGIGALLADGIGDTVRVSLTEPAENEIPVAAALVKHYQINYSRVENPALVDVEPSINPYNYERRETKQVLNIGAKEVPRIIADFSYKTLEKNDLMSLGHYYSFQLDKWHMNDLGVDFVYTGARPSGFMLPNGLKNIADADAWLAAKAPKEMHPYFASLPHYLSAARLSESGNFVRIRPADLAELRAVNTNGNIIWVVEPETTAAIYEYRNIVFRLEQLGNKQPVILKLRLNPVGVKGNTPEEEIILALGGDAGLGFSDGLLDGIWVTADFQRFSPELINRSVFNVLQACRQRITRTEYISCPSCGRTLFDLQETTAMIRERTEHLKGVKIAVMGCIVNGPGEMADADYGYVGSGPGIISLYRGKEMVKKGIKKEESVDELIELIRGDGLWREPERN